MQSHIHVQSYNQEKEKLKSIKMETNNFLYRCLRNEHVDEKSITLFC